MSDWQIPDDWARIRAVDSHTAGEPFRVILDGFPDLEGESILDRRRLARDRHDSLRQALMWEPRGHPDMYGCLLTPPVDPEADLAVLFMHNEGYSTMCGHGIIALATVALEIGLLRAEGNQRDIGIETPAGLVQATATLDDGLVTSVRFRNVPSFALLLDDELDAPGLGPIPFDVGFGGAFYAFVPAAAAQVGLTPSDQSALIDKGRSITQAVMANRAIEHPFHADLSFLYGTIFVGEAQGSGAHSRNVCIFADGQVDRCPTGTGVSARLALGHAREELEVGEWIEVESILGTRFRGRILETTDYGPHPAVIPEIEGAAHITGRHEFLIDPDDPLRDGFLLR